MVLARVEDDRSDFGPEARIGDDTLSEFVASFDPERRHVPVICAQGRDIPAHWSDPLPPVGEIVSLDRDLINLWGRAQSIIDPILDIPRLDLYASEGFNDRSIGFHLGSNETEGRASLFLLALLGGKSPGISNMPTLAAHGFGLDDEQIERLRNKRAFLGSDGITVAQLIGKAVGDLTREWAALGGLDNYRQLPRQAALEQAGRLSEVGVEAVEAWGESIGQLAQAQNGQVFREVRVGGGPPVQVNLAAHQFRVFSKPGVGVDERRLAVLSRAVEEVQRLHPGTNRLDPKTLERAAQRYLSVGAAR